MRYALILLLLTLISLPLSAASRYKLSIHTSGKDRLDVVVIGHTPSQYLMVVELECEHFYSRSQREIEEDSKSHTFTLHRSLHGVGEDIDQPIVVVIVLDKSGTLLTQDIGRFYLP